MQRQPSLFRLPATLLPAAGADGGGGYRLLVVGAAILFRPQGTTGPWHVRVATDRSLLPALPATRCGIRSRVAALRAAGGRPRVAAAILEPRDLPAVAPLLRATLRHHEPLRRREFYGWALMYQLPEGTGLGLVDPHDDHADLPAFYESPLELADRQEFLLSRGVSTRALALVTQRHDFDRIDGGSPRNRFCAAAHWDRTCGLAAFGT